MNSYNYRPLNAEIHEVRLLQIQKSSDESAPITLTLEHVSLKDGLYFNALSYTWGDETPTTQISICDDTSLGHVSVRRNLHELLKEARRSSEDWSSEWIWIDQISINQTDLGERGQQVGQMQLLYTVARATLVWPWSWSKSSVDIERTILAGQQIDLNEQVDLNEKIDFNEPIFNPQTQGAIVDASDRPTLSDIAGRLLDVLTYGQYVTLAITPYWHRLWIIQEIVLASSCYIILSGQLYKSYDVMEVVEIIEEVLQIRIYGVKMIKNRLSLLEGARLEKSMENWPTTKDMLRNRISWDMALYLGTTTECTEPLDRVYGVMGLLHKDLHIAPEYDIPEQELFRRILQKHLSTKMAYQLGRWEDVYEVLQVWQSIGLQHDRALLGNLNVDPLDPHRRKKIKPVVCHALDRLNISRPRRTFADTDAYLRPLKMKLASWQWRTQSLYKPKEKRVSKEEFLDKYYHVSRYEYL
jgi:hypothetical protein